MPTGGRGATTRARPRVCTAEVEGGHGHDCTRPVPDDAPMALCALHMALAAQWLAEHDLELARKVLGIAQHGPRLPIRNPGQVVYYLRFGDRIKIGTTTDLPQRLQALPHDELLAIEPGGMTLERTRHLQFADLRVTREWFEAAPVLFSHAHELREKHGRPLSAWERWRSDTPETADA